MGNADDGVIEHCGLRISATELAEIDGGNAVVTVQRSDIHSCSLGRGWQAERPAAMLGCGTILVVLGLVPVPHVVNWLLHGGVLRSTLLLMAMWLPFGAWGLYRATRRGFFLIVDGRDGRRKLAFSRAAKHTQIEELLLEAEKRFGYAFKRNV